MLLEHYLAIISVIPAALITNSCGFNIHERTIINQEFKKIRIIIEDPDPYEPLALEISQQLRMNKINLIEQEQNFHEDNNLTILKIISSFEKIKTVFIYKDGNYAEKQIDFGIRAQLILPNSRIYPINIHTEITFLANLLDPLSQVAEQEFIKQEMREQAVRQLINKLFLLYSYSYIDNNQSKSSPSQSQ